MARESLKITSKSLDRAGIAVWEATGGRQEDPPPRGDTAPGYLYTCATVTRLVTVRSPAEPLCGSSHARRVDKLRRNASLLDLRSRFVRDGNHIDTHLAVAALGGVRTAERSAFELHASGRRESRSDTFYTPTQRGLAHAHSGVTRRRSSRR